MPYLSNNINVCIQKSVWHSFWRWKSLSCVCNKKMFSKVTIFCNYFYNIFAYAILIFDFEHICIVAANLIRPVFIMNFFSLWIQWFVKVFNIFCNDPLTRIFIPNVSLSQDYYTIQQGVDSRMCVCFQCRHGFPIEQWHKKLFYEKFFKTVFIMYNLYISLSNPMAQ